MNAYFTKAVEYLARRLLARAVVRAAGLMDEFDEASEHAMPKALPTIRLPEIEYRG